MSKEQLDSYQTLLNDAVSKGTAIPANLPNGITADESQIAYGYQQAAQKALSEKTPTPGAADLSNPILPQAGQAAQPGVYTTGTPTTFIPRGENGSANYSGGYQSTPYNPARPDATGFYDGKKPTPITGTDPTLGAPGSTPEGTTNASFGAPPQAQNASVAVNEPQGQQQAQQGGPAAPGGNLQPGSTGQDVVALQNYLVGKGFLSQAEMDTGPGTYGTKTQAAVAKLQASLGVPNTGGVGYYGPKTQAAIAAGTLGAPQFKDQPAVAPTNPAQPDAPQKTVIQSVIDDYAAAYNSLGLGDIKKQYQDYVKQQTDLTNQMNDEISGVNNNPWLSQGVRDRTIEQVQKKYETRLDTLSNQVQYMDSLYKQGQAEVDNIVGAAEKITADQQQQAYEIAKQRQDAIDALNSRSPSDIYGTGSIGEYNFAVSQGYTGSFSDYQNEDANRKAKASGSGLGGIFNASQINQTVNQIAGNFDNEQIVKDYNQISQSLQAVKTAGTSPTDDIQRVYAFAKIMDPNSVVREGEYNTVEKYAQAVIQHAGLKAVRVFDNTGFLTPEARTLMETTLDNRFAATESAYKNLYTQYQNRIDAAKTGQGNTLTDYSAGASSATKPVIDPLGIR